MCELAAIEADRGNPVAARDLLRDAGVNVDIDLDTEFDPLTADQGFGAELAEEMSQHFSPEDYPHLIEFTVEHVMKPGYDFTKEFDFGLHLILDGLAAAVARTG